MCSICSTYTTAPIIAMQTKLQQTSAKRTLALTRASKNSTLEHKQFSKGAFRCMLVPIPPNTRENPVYYILHVTTTYYITSQVAELLFFALDENPDILHQKADKWTLHFVARRQKIAVCPLSPFIGVLIYGNVLLFSIVKNVFSISRIGLSGYPLNVFVFVIDIVFVIAFWSK